MPLRGVLIHNLVGVAIFGIGVGLHVVGTGTHEWLVVESSRPRVHRSIGLFQVCQRNDCDDIPEDAIDHPDVVPALCITAIIVSAIGSMLWMASFFTAYRGKSAGATPYALSMFSLLAFWVAGIMIFIGVGLFTIYDYDTVIQSDPDDYGYSFVLCVVGAFLIVFGGTLAGAGMGNITHNEKTNQGYVISSFQQPITVHQQRMGGVKYPMQGGGVMYPKQVGGVMFQQQVGGAMFQQPNQPRMGAMMYSHLPSQPQQYIKPGRMMYLPRA